MAIKYFIFSILTIAIILLAATVTQEEVKQIEKTKLPLVTFVNSTIYEINTKETTQIIQSKKAFHYENKDKLFDATVVLRTNIDTNKSITDTIHSKYIEVTPKLLKFRGDVRYNRMAMTALYSEEMDYDRIKHKLIGNQKFTAYHDGNILKGGKMLVDKETTTFIGEDNKPVKLNITLKKDNNETN